MNISQSYLICREGRRSMSCWVGVVKRKNSCSYYFTIHTTEGQLIMESDSYKSRRSATNGILICNVFSESGSVAVCKRKSVLFDVLARNRKSSKQYGICKS